MPSQPRFAASICTLTMRALWDRHDQRRQASAERLQSGRCNTGRPCRPCTHCARDCLLAGASAAPPYAPPAVTSPRPRFPTCAFAALSGESQRSMTRGAAAALEAHVLPTRHRTRRRWTGRTASISATMPAGNGGGAGVGSSSPIILAHGPRWNGTGACLSATTSAARWPPAHTAHFTAHTDAGGQAERSTYEEPPVHCSVGSSGTT